MNVPCHIDMEDTGSVSSFVAMMSRKAEEDLRCLQADVENMISLKIDSMKKRHKRFERHIIPALLKDLHGKHSSPEAQHDVIFDQPWLFDTGKPASVMSQDRDSVCSDLPCVHELEPGSKYSHRTHGECAREQVHDLKLSCLDREVNASNPSHSITELPPTHSVHAQSGPPAAAITFFQNWKSETEPFKRVTAPEWNDCSDIAASHSGINHASNSQKEKEEPEASRQRILVPQRPPANERSARRQLRCKRPSTVGALPGMALPAQMKPLQNHCRIPSREEDDQLGVAIFASATSPALPVILSDLHEDGSTSDSTDSDHVDSD